MEDSLPSRVERDSRNVPAAETFVGREAEFATLCAAVEGLASGQGSTWLLSGEPGIGKTRVCEELRSYARERGVEVLFARCHQGEGSPPFWPWVQAFRAFARARTADELDAQLGPDRADVAQLVPELREEGVGASDSPQLDELEARFRQFDSVASVLGRASAAKPLLLVLDDLHWADPPSVRLLSFLTRNAGDTPLLLVATLRDVGVAFDPALESALAELEPQCQTLALGGLSAGDVSRFVESATRAVLPPPLSERLHAETGGNPLFLGEFVKLLASQGGFERDGVADGLLVDLPRGVRSTVLQRVDLLSSAARRVLQVAAVCGRDFELAPLGGALRGDADIPALPDTATDADWAALVDLLDEAERARLLQRREPAERGYRFSHALIRESLYDALPVRERIALHRRVGEALEDLHGGDADYLAPLAHHFGEAAADGWVAPAVRYATRAAEHALEVLAFEDAIAHYQQAIALLERKGAETRRERCELLLELARAQQLADLRDDNAETAYQAARIARDLGDPVLLARAALSFQILFGAISISNQEIDTRRIQLVEEAVERLGDRDAGLRARALAYLSVLLIYAAPIERRARLSDESLELARGLRDPDVLRFALSARVWALFDPENAAERVALSDEIISLASGNGTDLVAGLVARIDAHLELGDRGAVDADIETHALLAERARRPGLGWMSAVYRATVATLDGRIEEAERQVTGAFALGQRVQNPNAVQAFGVQLGRVRYEQGRLAEVVQLIQTYSAQFPEQWAWQCGLEHFRAEAGEDVRPEYRQLLGRDLAALPRDSLWLPALGLLSELVVRYGDTRAAERVYPLMLPCARRNVMVAGSIANFGPSSRCLAGLALTLGRWDEAWAHFDAALDTCADIGDRTWSAHTLRNLACALIAHGEPASLERAEAVCAQARAAYEELGTTSFLARLPEVADAAAGIAVARPQAAPGSAPATPNLMRREGGVWLLRFEDASVRMPDSKGLRYVARLVSEPDREIHVSDLVASESSASAGRTPARAPADTTAGRGEGLEVLDDRARAAYRSRIEELREDLAEAERFDDAGRAEQARTELDLIEQELGAAVGLGGRARRTADPVERARKSVYNAIRFSLSRLEAEHRPLGQHLARSVETGTYCAYRPDQTVLWDVETS